MRLWLWDAGNHRGVTDDEDRARAVAVGCLNYGGIAKVELAVLVTVTADGIESGYERSGIGDIGLRTGDRVVWTPLR